MAASDPSKTSHYVTDAFYDELVAAFADWQRDAALVSDPRIVGEAAALLNREARLLDHRDFDGWLALFVPECAYWVPATADGGDPRAAVAITFDDRRRLEDRVYRLRTGYAWSQEPPSRTVRQIGNIEVFGGDAPELWMVRSTFLITELRAGETRRLAGWCGHRITRLGDALRIRAKQVNLIDCDRNLRNPSIIL